MAKAKLARAAVGGAPQQAGELRRGKRAAALVEQGEQRALRQRRLDQRRLGRRPAAAAVLDLDDPGRSEPERARDPVEARQVVGDELRLRTAAQAAHRDDRHPQGGVRPLSAACGRGAGCGSHIFSSW